ncbi:hypothetical protein JHW45_06250 [Paracoccus stylophorae]|uniref:Uncharacterized protein n=1 Tax=Paracoccus stylophorae TaxID=659350 RepID=A0ABY7SY22_9RHOB|nr:hypothetical protein [Paracoccus stylophorae]WCR11955.1 hypothetical protein JHW45_06250 [Paracoccus stylophorae]
MSALEKHLDKQQEVAMHLLHVIDAIDSLVDGKASADEVTPLISIARYFATNLYTDLDCVNLP